MANELRKAHAAVREFALGFPGAREEFPWGECVVKVGKKIFVFLGKPDTGFGIGVKLPVTGSEALELPFTEPSHYGLGKHGWVSASFAPGEHPPLGLLFRWIDESYRAVAPKKLVAQLDQPPDPPAKTGPPAKTELPARKVVRAKRSATAPRRSPRRK